jgi:hypothetical protein
MPNEEGLSLRNTVVRVAPSYYGQTKVKSQVLIPMLRAFPNPACTPEPACVPIATLRSTQSAHREQLRRKRDHLNLENPGITDDYVHAKTKLAFNMG